MLASMNQLRSARAAAVRPAQHSLAPALRPQRRSLVARSEVAPGGQVSSALMDSMSNNIREALEAKQVKVTDVYGDGRHVAIEVVSPQFEGKSAMQRQRMVYKVRNRE